MDFSNEPSQAEIDRLKAQNPERALKLLTLAEENGEVLHFIVSGPNRSEYEKLSEDVLKFEKPGISELDKTNGIKKAMETLALQQIRWPERAQVVALFDKYPTISVSIGAKVREYAGDSFEVRSKKL